MGSGIGTPANPSQEGARFSRQAWFSARCQDAHACTLVERHTLVGAVVWLLERHTLVCRARVRDGGLGCTIRFLR